MSDILVVRILGSPSTIVDSYVSKNKRHQTHILQLVYRCAFVFLTAEFTVHALIVGIGIAEREADRV